jgi:hypothetical protein
MIGHRLHLDHHTAEFRDYLGDDLLEPPLNQADQHTTTVLRAPNHVVLNRKHRLVRGPALHEPTVTTTDRNGPRRGPVDGIAIPD